MDPLTHTLVGASLSATRLGEKTRYATAALVIGANLPDVDVLSYFAGGDFALGFRRGWTHGVLALAFLPALLAAALLLWHRLRSPNHGMHGSSEARWLFALCYLATLTHPFLDWLNTYGMRWWMPFRDTWYYGDSVFIIDPWLWLLLGGGWLLSRQASRKSHGFSSRAAAGAGLAAGALFILSMLLLHRATEDRVRERLVELDPRPIANLMVGPIPANPLAWEFVVEQGDRLRYGRASWLGDRFLHFTDFDRPSARSSELWTEAESSGQAAGFLSWVRLPWVEVDPGPTAIRLHIMDARYTRVRTAGFGGALVTLLADTPGSGTRN